MHVKPSKKVKRDSWQNYVSNLNTSSKLKTVWDIIKKIAGIKQTTLVKHLSMTNKNYGKKAIADLVAGIFPKNSSCQVNKKFLEIKLCRREKIKFHFKHFKDYNAITLTELADSINKSPNTTVSPDEIHNQFLKQLLDESVK